MARFEFDLARALGRTRAELRHSMSAPEFNQWLALWSIDPWSEERADLRTAQLTALLANVYAAKGAVSAKPLDFMPWSKPAPTKRKTGAELLAFFKAMTPKRRSKSNG